MGSLPPARPVWHRALAWFEAPSLGRTTHCKPWYEGQGVRAPETHAVDYDYQLATRQSERERRFSDTGLNESSALRIHLRGHVPEPVADGPCQFGRCVATRALRALQCGGG